MFTPFLVGVKVGFQKIGEKENFQYDKHNKQLYQNDNPNLTAPITYVSKATNIKLPDSDKYVFLFHNRIGF
jgi:hypothetical protein